MVGVGSKGALKKTEVERKRRKCRKNRQGKILEKKYRVRDRLPSWKTEVKAIKN
jgi:hypothetical protein